MTKTHTRRSLQSTCNKGKILFLASIFLLSCFPAYGNPSSSVSSAPILTRSSKKTLQKEDKSTLLASLSTATLPTSNLQPKATALAVHIPWQRIISLSLLLPWVYFLCGAMNIPTLPRYVNYAIASASSASSDSSASSASSATQVSSKGAEVYGNINGIDSFFTFLSVNLIGVLSDQYGRKVFMMMASLGLALSHLCMSYATLPIHFYVSSIIDGLTSCMLSQSQAYIADILCLQQQVGATNATSPSSSTAAEDADNNVEKKDPQSIGIALSRFQGVCIGVAYLIGIPLGAKVAKMKSNRTPLQVSGMLGIFNAFLIGLFLPNIQKYQRLVAQKTAEANNTPVTEAKKINWSLANPFGAIYLFRRNARLLIGGLVYFLVNFAHSSLQVNWINYLQYRYGWSATLSGSTLMIVGLVVAILPSVFVPLIGKLPAIKYSLLIHSLISVFLGWNQHPYGIFLTMPILAAGASAMPMLLGYLTEQVDNDEVGNLQGAADTLRTISAVIAAPISAKIFSLYLGLNSAPSNVWYRPLCEKLGPGVALYFTAIFSFLGFVIFQFLPSSSTSSSSPLSSSSQADHQQVKKKSS